MGAQCLGNREAVTSIDETDFPSARDRYQNLVPRTPRTKFTLRLIPT